jgi:5-methyltetrahydropteroyltriglutamate--homocysteine methyltransferase
VARDKLVACTNCGMAPMKRATAEAKLRALVQGAEQAAARA